MVRPALKRRLIVPEAAPLPLTWTLGERCAGSTRPMTTSARADWALGAGSGAAAPGTAERGPAGAHAATAATTSEVNTHANDRCNAVHLLARTCYQARQPARSQEARACRRSSQVTPEASGAQPR